MPLYAYRCTECGHKFEKIQNFSAEPEKECPKCHGVLERPLSTAPGLSSRGRLVRERLRVKEQRVEQRKLVDGDEERNEIRCEIGH